MSSTRSKRFQSGREIFEFYVPSLKALGGAHKEERSGREIGIRAAEDVLRRHKKDFARIRERVQNISPERSG